MLASCGARKFNAAGHNSVAIADKEKPRMSGAFFLLQGCLSIGNVEIYFDHSLVFSLLCVKTAREFGFFSRATRAY